MDNDAAIKARLAAGESPEAIAIRLGVDLQEVEDVAEGQAEQRQEQQSNVEILRDNLRLIQKLIPTAEWTYQAAPDVDNAAALVQLVSTSIQTIKEIESRKDPAVMMNEILGKVLQPIFRNFIRLATIETAKARGSLNQALPPDTHAAVDTIIKNIVAGLGRVLSADYKNSIEALSGIMGCKSGEAKIQPMLKVVQGGDTDEQPTESQAVDPAVAEGRQGS